MYYTDGTLTDFGRAMQTLGVEIMYANSPQVKGRFEHGNRTHQDRLVNFDNIFFSQTERQVRNDYTITLAGQYIQLLHNDEPLLSLVDNPVAVDPDSTLAEIARARGWPMISLR